MGLGDWLPNAWEERKIFVMIDDVDKGFTHASGNPMAQGFPAVHLVAQEYETVIAEYEPSLRKVTLLKGPGSIYPLRVRELIRQINELIEMETAEFEVLRLPALTQSHTR